MICLTYQSVLSSEVFAITTSRRMPSTSCAYQSGNVSLSPTVTRMPYGSTELSRSCAKSRVLVSPRRDDALQLPKSGMKARARTGDAMAQLRRVGRLSVCLPSFTDCVPTMAAIDSQTKTRPNAAHTLHDEKLQSKK